MVFLRRIKIEAKEQSSFKKKKRKENLGDKKWFIPEGKLIVDVYETDYEIVIQSAIAGVRPEDLEISIENDILEIKGNRPNPEEGNKKKNYFLQECWWGPFSRKIILPEEIDNSQIQASMKEGVLTIRIPKIEKEKRKRIRLK